MRADCLAIVPNMNTMIFSMSVLVLTTCGEAERTRRPVRAFLREAVRDFVRRATRPLPFLKTLCALSSSLQGALSV
ncbi:hypothetical protein C8Q80DRAFT_1213663 [Daedaleopsis nitida]|nr:hypothetical protein C8Q80DRAFT_1213663 [Daedaleopsis nitida]